MKRIKQIDGFRAIAILLVISFHYINNQLVHTQSKLGSIIYKLTSFGWVGVDLFFVLSGFLIGSILLINNNSPNLFKTFFIRRFVRIVPNYYLLIILFIIITALPYFKTDYFITGNNIIPSWSYFIMVHNFFMAALHNMGNDAMSITWSIGIEEQFYILFPFFIVFIKNRWLPYFLILLIISAIIFRSFCSHWIPAYVLLPCRMDAIAFGILIAWINQKFEIIQYVKRYYLLLLSFIVLAVSVCGFLFWKFQDLGIIRNTLFAFIFSCLIIISLGRPGSWLSGFLSNAILGWIGKISYSLYLFHYLIIGLVNNIGGRFLDMSSMPLRVFLTISALVISLVFSWIVYTFLEKPAVNIGKKFNYISG